MTQHERGSTAAIYQQACEILQEADHSASMREEYSGRGMYGATCPAIVTDAAGPLVGWAVTVAAGDQNISLDDAVLEVPTRQDNMGRDEMVYYGTH